MLSEGLGSASDGGGEEEIWHVAVLRYTELSTISCCVSCNFIFGVSRLILVTKRL